MQSKVLEVAALLQDKKVCRVTIETPDNRVSIKETTLQNPEGIAVSVEGDTITFKTEEKTASFVLLENAQVLTNRTDEEFIVVTFAENGGLQAVCRCNP
jgi:ribosomal protein L6P/L9E